MGTGAMHDMLMGDGAGGQSFPLQHAGYNGPMYRTPRSDATPQTYILHVHDGLCCQQSPFYIVVRVGTESACTSEGVALPGRPQRNRYLALPLHR